MLRNVVVHINNEQPIIVDLVAEPVPSGTAASGQTRRRKIRIEALGHVALYVVARLDQDHDADAVSEPPADVLDGDIAGGGTDSDGLDDDLLRRIREA